MTEPANDLIVSSDSNGKGINQLAAENGKITVIIQDPDGNEAGQFIAEDGKSIADQAVANGVILPLSCGAGVCGVCLCKVISGGEILKADAFNSPMMPLQNDEKGNPIEVLTCIAGFKAEAFVDGQNHTVVLQRTY